MEIRKICEDFRESFDPWFESCTTHGVIVLANKPDVYMRQHRKFKYLQGLFWWHKSRPVANKIPFID